MSAHSDFLKSILVNKKGSLTNTKFKKDVAKAMKQGKTTTAAPVAKVERGAARGS